MHAPQASCLYATRSYHASNPTCSTKTLGEATRVDIRRLFPGYGTAFLPSLVLAVSELTGERPTTSLENKSGLRGEIKSTPSARCYGGGASHSAHWGLGSNTKQDISRMQENEELLFKACVERLLQVATPEAMCRLREFHEAKTLDVVCAAGEPRLVVWCA